MSSGRASAPISFATHCAQFFLQLVRRLLPASSVTNADIAWPFQFVGPAHDRGLGHLRMRHQRRLDLHRAEPVAADVDHVVDAAHDPVVAVVVAPGAVAGEIDARDL